MQLCTCRTASTALIAAMLLSAAASAETGPRVEGGMTAVYQQETGDDLSDESLSGDLIVYWPTTGGEWMLYVEGSTETADDSIFNLYPEINADAGSAQQDNGGGRLQISELNYRFDLANGHQLTVGQFDPSAHLDRSRIANDENAHFLGAGFVNNPAIQFPDYTLGFMYRAPRTADRPEITAILSSSDGLADNPGRSYRELIDIGAAGKGLFAGLGARWAIGEGRLGAGVWLRTDDHDYVDGSDRSSRNYGAYAVYGWQKGTHGFNLRGGLGRESVSPVAAFLAAAYEAQTRLGAVGIGIGRIFASSNLDAATSDDTTHIEAFLRVRLPVRDSHLSLSVQHLNNSGFDRTGTVIDSSALIAGLRFHIWFGG